MFVYVRLFSMQIHMANDVNYIKHMYIYFGVFECVPYLFIIHATYNAVIS